MEGHFDIRDSKGYEEHLELAELFRSEHSAVDSAIAKAASRINTLLADEDCVPVETKRRNLAATGRIWLLTEAFTYYIRNLWVKVGSQFREILEDRDKG